MSTLLVQLTPARLSFKLSAGSKKRSYESYKSGDNEQLLKDAVEGWDEYHKSNPKSSFKSYAEKVNINKSTLYQYCGTGTTKKKKLEDKKGNDKNISDADKEEFCKFVVTNYAEEEVMTRFHSHPNSVKNLAKGWSKFSDLDKTQMMLQLHKYIKPLLTDLFQKKKNANEANTSGLSKVEEL